MMTKAEIAEREKEFARLVDMADKADTIAEAFEHLTQAVLLDGGDAPCSRYGTRACDFAPVAALASLVYADVTGEPILPESHDHMISLVVNDHDDPAYTIVAHGADVLDRLGAHLTDYLDEETVSEAQYDEGE